MVWVLCARPPEAWSQPGAAAGMINYYRASVRQFQTEATLVIRAGMCPMTDDADATPATPDPDDHVARLRAQIDAAKARRAGYRAQAAETVARGGPARATDEELGIVKTDDTVGRIAGDASQEIRSRLSRVMSRFGRRGKK